jgi:hypothetical protein
MRNLPLVSWRWRKSELERMRTPTREIKRLPHRVAVILSPRIAEARMAVVTGTVR